ncbi:DUF4224 domain-containing protein [Roseateles sp. SL47]|uniref:DUF4224 domain-containing protein n=1 Tax=Roseateles sp. SL47 TaxID=2995138 RepID=UPI00227185AD|nr:DUF4224 domain-containing protein [Roseateles sp. SL47]WAC72111.1 DUF4224 domain-containing protein [Roseateles sp. SL47]
MAERSRPIPPDLTREEVDEICHPLVQNAAKVRFLRGMGIKVEQRPDGSPLVSREHYVQVRQRAASAGSQLMDDAAVTSDGPAWGVH